MFKRLRHKNYPDFWKKYLDHFKNKKECDLNSTRFVIFDTETTGLQHNKDRILSIGAISIVGNVIDVADTFELYLKQEKFDANTVEIHGILKEGKILKLEEEKSIVLFLDYIKSDILVAHHVAFDVAMINESLKRLGLPRLKNKVLDTGILFKNTKLCPSKDTLYSLDALCTIFNIKKQDRHTASGDAYLTGIIFLKIISQLSNSRQITLKHLFRNPHRRGLL